MHRAPTVCGDQVVGCGHWAQSVQHSLDPIRPQFLALQKVNTRPKEGQGGAQSLPVGSVAIPGLHAIPTLLCKTRPLLGFDQGPVTFCSNGSHLVVKLHPSALLQGLLQCCASGLGLQGSGDTHFPMPAGTGFPGQWESRG